MRNVIRVRCIFENNKICVKIQPFITSKELQVSIYSPKQEDSRYDKYIRGFVGKKSSAYCNWPHHKST